MKNLILILCLFLSANVLNAQNVVSLEQFQDNIDSYVGKQITIWVSYDNKSSGCQLRACCGKFNDEFKLWKHFTWFLDMSQSITINIPNKFFDNDGASMPNVTSGGSLLATVYVYRGHNHKIEPKAGTTYNESESGISLELVGIKRKS